MHWYAAGLPCDAVCSSPLPSQHLRGGHAQTPDEETAMPALERTLQLLARASRSFYHKSRHRHNSLYSGHAACLRQQSCVQSVLLARASRTIDTPFYTYTFTWASQVPPNVISVCQRRMSLSCDLLFSRISCLFVDVRGYATSVACT